MILDNLLLQAIVLITMFLIYNYIIFEFVDTILENPKLKKTYRIPLGLINTVLAFMLTILPSSTSFASYILIIIVLLIEFRIFYKDTLLRVTFVTLACSIHIMAVRAICVSIFAMVTGLPIYNLVNDIRWLVASMSLTFAMLNICVFLVIRFISAKSIRIINQHNDQLTFMTAWLAVANVYFIFNAPIYSNNSLLTFIVQNQLAVSIFILFSVYIVLFFTISTGQLLNYKEKNDELLQVVENEHQFRDSVTSDALAVYEVILSRNILSKGFDQYSYVLEKYNHNYSDIIVELIPLFVYSEDVNMFMQYALTENLLMEYHSGKTESEIEYRRLTPDGNCFWAKAICNLYADRLTGDIKAFTYVKDIHDEKLNEISLKNQAEIDMLTGLYNKGHTEKLISNFISVGNEHNYKGALFIIDVDNFKDVNDRLGHVFGDAVLCELSEKLRTIFRSASSYAIVDGREDIIGRIGGDEFMVFMKNTVDLKILIAKAESVCKAFRNTYKSTHDITTVISCSIGIALFPEDGMSFDELYKNADIALYLSKGKGKNIYSFYSGENFVGYESKRGEINSINSLPQKSFHDNRIEYTFKILYDTSNHISAVQSVLQLLTDSMNFSRGYIFETSEDGKYTSNTYEWCADGIEPQIDNLQNLPIETINVANQAFLKDKYFIVNSLDGLTAEESAILKPQGIKSMLHFGIFDSGKLVGFIGFDECKVEVRHTQAQIWEMKTLCNILASSILKQRHADRAEKEKQMFIAVMDSMDSYVYVVNPINHEVLFANKKTMKMFGCDNSGGKCYTSFRGISSPCSDCPLQKLGNMDADIPMEFYNNDLGIWLKSDVNFINWTNGEQVAIISCSDITKYKN